MIRRFQLIVIAAILLIAAFSTELDFLFYLVYLAILVVGGSYILTRLGLADLEAGSAVNRCPAACPAGRSRSGPGRSGPGSSARR